MHNQHAGLSQSLAEQRITERHEQAARARLARGARPRRHRRWLARWWQLARRHASLPSRPSDTHTGSVDRSEAPMSKRIRTLVVTATLAAITLAGTSTAAYAQVTDEHARRPPTQGQVGESWHQRQVTAEQPTIASDARRPPTESQVGESWRHQTSVPGRPAEPGRQPGWRIASLVFLATALALVGGLAVLAATRPSRGPQVGQAP